MKTNKMKEWFDGHKDEIKTEVVKMACYAVGFGFGYFAASKITDYRITAGLACFHDDGIIKFCDPSTGLEVGVREAHEVVKKFYNKD